MEDPTPRQARPLAKVELVVWILAAVAFVGFLASLGMASLAEYKVWLGVAALLLAIIGALLRVAMREASADKP